MALRPTARLAALLRTLVACGADPLLADGAGRSVVDAAGVAADGALQGERYRGQGAHLNPLGLFLRTSIACIWRILSAFLPA
jgi:hypothetical protein